MTSNHAQPADEPRVSQRNTAAAIILFAPPRATTTFKFALCFHKSACAFTVLAVVSPASPAAVSCAAEHFACVHLTCRLPSSGGPVTSGIDSSYYYTKFFDSIDSARALPSPISDELGSFIVLLRPTSR